jgi:hypothetical protein
MEQMIGMDAIGQGLVNFVDGLGGAPMPTFAWF